MKRYYYIILAGSLAVACTRNDKSDAYGNFEAVEVVIAAETNGKILQMNVEEGREVGMGDTLALIDTTDLSLKKEQVIRQKSVLHARLRTIDSQIAVQEQQKKNILVDKGRVESLMKDGAATQKQLDDITGNIDLIEQQIEATRVQKESVLAEMGTLEVQVSQIDETISKSWVTSPLTGTVLVRYAERGEVTALSRPLCKIANLEALELKVYISGDQLPYLRLGQTVEVLIDKDRKDYSQLVGTVSWISSKAEFTPKTIQTKKERVNLVYAAKVVVANDGRLKIGMPGEINFMPAAN